MPFFFGVPAWILALVIVGHDGGFADFRGALAGFGGLGLATAEKGGSKEEGQIEPA